MPFRGQIAVHQQLSALSSQFPPYASGHNSTTKWSTPLSDHIRSCPCTQLKVIGFLPKAEVPKFLRNREKKCLSLWGTEGMEEKEREEGSDKED